MSFKPEINISFNNNSIYRVNELIELIAYTLNKNFNFNISLIIDFPFEFFDNEFFNNVLELLVVNNIKKIKLIIKETIICNQFIT